LKLCRKVTSFTYDLVLVYRVVSYSCIGIALTTRQAKWWFAWCFVTRCVYRSATLCYVAIDGNYSCHRISNYCNVSGPWTRNGERGAHIGHSQSQSRRVGSTGAEGDGGGATKRSHSCKVLGGKDILGTRISSHLRLSRRAYKLPRQSNLTTKPNNICYVRSLSSARSHISAHASLDSR
jgi:hypothetical protein